MKDSKLIQLLKTLTREEWKDFEKFVESPYFNKGRNYLTFLNELKKYHPHFDSNNLTRENLYVILYPGKKYKESVIFTITSGLQKLAEEFIIQEKIKEKEYIRKSLLLEGFTARNLNHHSQKLINQIESSFKSKKRFSHEDFFNKMILYDNIHDFYYLTDNRKKVVVYRMELLKFSIYYSFFTIMDSGKQLIIEKAFMNSKSDFSFMQEITSCFNIEKFLSILENFDKKNHILMLAPYYVYMAYNNPDDESFYYKFNSYLEQNSDNFDIDYINRLYKNLNSICSLYAIRGKFDFNEEQFKIFNKQLEKNLFKDSNDNKYFSTRGFRNGIVNALNLKKIDWAEKFVREYIGKVDPEFQNRLFHFSMARIFYEKGDYEKALYHAAEVEQKQIIFKLDIKLLLCKIYFDIDSTEPLISLMDTYVHLLKNSECKNKDLITRHENFVKTLKEILKMKLNNSENYELNNVKEKINKIGLISNRRWLLKKVDELVNT